jgi:CBS domain-containing protein
MKCRDLMNPEVLWISGSASVRQAATMMRDQSVALLLVSGPPEGQFAGIVTDRDLAMRVCAEDLCAQETPVSAVTTTEVLVCSDIEDLRAAEKRMRDAQTSRLVVVDHHGAPVGMLSLTDILHGDRGWRALKTARGVLRHEAEIPHPPVESIKLTASTPEDEAAAMRHRSIRTGSWRISTKEFPG